MIHPDYQGCGYATEAVGAVLRELREMGFRKVIAGFFSENSARRRVMEKCGITAVMPDAMQREFPIRSVSFQPKEQGLKNSDFIIAIGGDGTILHVAQDAVRYDIPVWGLTRGEWAFLPRWNGMKRI